MTSKPGPTVGFVTANVGPKRATHGSSKARPSPRRRNDWRLVPVEVVLFAEMEQPSLAEAFSDTEIHRLAATFGLSADEIAALYPRAALKPTATDVLPRRRGRSTPAR
jgi:hypothetical protein